MYRTQKILVLPDAHLHLDLLSRVDTLLTEHPDWECVSLGDWCDDWDRPLSSYEDFFTQFLMFCRAHLTNLFLCWGNHDYGYARYPHRHSGYSDEAQVLIQRSIVQIDKMIPIHLVLARHGILFSHAGVTKAPLKHYTAQLNSPEALSRSFTEWISQLPPERVWQQDYPLWHRPTHRPLKDTFDLNILQVVGHTPVSTITYDDTNNILYTDTWSTTSDRTPLGDHSLVLLTAYPDLPLAPAWEVIY